MHEGADLDQKRDENEKNNSIQSRGKTLEIAIEQGLAQLNLSEDQVAIDVIQEGSRGIFGFGAEDAIVRLTPKVPLASEDEAVEAKAARAGTDETETDNRSDDGPEATAEARPAETKPETVQPETSAPESTPSDSITTEVGIDETTQKRAREILDTLLQKMSVQAEVLMRVGHDLVEPGETPPLTLDITGSDLGVLIGRRGETLRALQFIVRQILSKEAGHWIPVVVDVESYLVRRRKSLKQLAERMADKVVSSNRKVTLEPMSAQERRIIHLQLRDHEAVYTQSIGEDERRKVVIYPKRP